MAEMLCAQLAYSSQVVWNSRPAVSGIASLITRVDHALKSALI